MEKYVFVTLEITDGEAQYYIPGAHILPADTTIEAFADDLAKHWYDFDEDDEDDIPQKDDNECYEHLDGNILAKVEKAIEIPEAHYKIIKQYI